MKLHKQDQIKFNRVFFSRYDFYTNNAIKTLQNELDNSTSPRRLKSLLFFQMSFSITSVTSENVHQYIINTL